jgi:hypothetical protein
MMDRYLDANPFVAPNDLQLLGVTCYFIISKIVEIESLHLGQMEAEMCFYKYSQRDFLRMETKVTHALNYNIETPTIFEFL